MKPLNDGRLWWAVWKASSRHRGPPKGPFGRDSDWFNRFDFVVDGEPVGIEIHMRRVGTIFALTTIKYDWPDQFSMTIAFDKQGPDVSYKIIWWRDDPKHDEDKLEHALMVLRLTVGA